MTSKNKLYDFSNRDHNEVKNLVKQIAEHCEDRSVTGMIVIFASAKESGTQVFRAGVLAKKNRIAFESAKLHLAMLLDRSDEI